MVLDRRNRLHGVGLADVLGARFRKPEMPDLAFRDQLLDRGREAGRLLAGRLTAKDLEPSANLCPQDGRLEGCGPSVKDAAGDGDLGS